MDMEDKRPDDCEQDCSSLDIKVIHEEELEFCRSGSPSQVLNVVSSYLAQFESTGKLEDLEKAMVCLNEAISHTPKDHLELPSRLGKLSVMLQDRYKRLGSLTDLEKAIECENQAVLLIPKGHSEMPVRLNNLGIAVQTRFQHLGNLADLNQAIECMTQSISLAPENHPDMINFLGSLSQAFGRRYEHLGELNDLDKATDYSTKAFSLLPENHAGAPMILNNLGCLFNCRFQRLGLLVDLDKAIEYYSKGAMLISSGGLGKTSLLGNLGDALESRFERLGNLADLDEAIKRQRQAVDLTPQGHLDKPNWHNSIGCSLQKRFERLGNIDDLNDAIAHQSLAVSLTPEGHYDIPIWLSNLGSSLSSRYDCLGDILDLDKAIKCRSDAVLLALQDHPLMPSWLSNLGHSLSMRYERLGKLPDLDKAIKNIMLAVSLMPEVHPGRPGLLNNMGTFLGRRFKRLGERADLDKAIEYQSRAVEITPNDHPNLRIWVNNLGVSLVNRYEVLHDLVDLDKAINYQKQAVSLTTDDHIDLPIWLNNLSHSIGKRFERLSELADLHKTIEHSSKAVDLTPQGHSNMPTLLKNLGTLLNIRFKRLGNLADLDKAIDYMNQAVSLTPRDHALMPWLLRSLGQCYKDRSELPAMTKDIDRSLDCFQKAAQSKIGSPAHRFYPALDWARTCAEHCSSSLLLAYEHVMTILPQVVWLGATVGNRYRNITEIGSVSTEAAAAAIAAKEYGLALEWLEEGRSIVWKQMLQLRTPIDDLAVVAPILATEIKRVARDLDYASSPKQMHNVASSNTVTLEQAAQQHRRLAEEWEDLINEARRIPGFTAFLRQQKASELMYSAQSGLVTVINVHQKSCDALIILPGAKEILHLPLPFSYEKAAQSRARIVHFARSRDVGRYVKLHRPERKDTFEKALGVLWFDLVKPILDYLGYLKSSTGSLPRITWCTTGPLSFLPLHAAGDYDSQSMIFNYVVSSYTPTLSALLAPPSSSKFSGILAVGQSSTPGMSPLPGTVTELIRVREKFQGHIFTKLDEDLATPEAVLAGIEVHSWVHLACHAIQNAASPMHSTFYLHDGTLDLATVSQKQLKCADLAFLSACQTATGDESLSEEAVHLAAGMLMAGYRTVIATMWSIGDEDAPLIAEEVYEYLLEGGVPDARRAAVALHKATARLREKVGLKAFDKWVPYIHIGL